MVNSSNKADDTKIKQKTKFSRGNLLVFVALFAVIGGYFIFQSFAEQVALSKVEAEQMSLPVGATIVANASASGGQVVRMDQIGSLKNTVSLTASSSSFTVNASAQKCRKSWPQLKVLIDGIPLLTSTVNGTSLKAFSATTPISAGSHSIELLNIPATVKNCTTPMSIDNIVFYGEGTVTPPPPPPLSVPSIFISPYTQTVGLTGTITVEVRENSGTTSVNAVQTNISYPADKLDFVNADYSTSAFTTTAVSSASNGQIVIARGIIGSLTGDQLVAKVTFKAKGIASTTDLSFTNGTALISSTTNQGIITSLSSTRGAVINISSTSAVLPPRKS